jgi:hypothetical protein
MRVRLLLLWLLLLPVTWVLRLCTICQLLLLLLTVLLLAVVVLLAIGAILSAVLL